MFQRQVKRSTAQLNFNVANNNNKQNGKRKAEASPTKGIKRCALGDISNAKKDKENANPQILGKSNVNPQVPGKSNVNSLVPAKSNTNLKLTGAKDLVKPVPVQSKRTTRSTTERELNSKNSKLTKEIKDALPDGVVDYDKEVGDDPFQVGLYAHDIFKYYKTRESKFPVTKYLVSQPELNKNMRSILVDWLVEVQESFELNHETLYLAVKLIDLFLGKVVIKRDKLQLVGTTAFWIASKFDERTSPSIDDFCYICDDAYSSQAILKMEVKMLKTLDYDIGAPLSYRFLRRYARCAKLDLEILTLARYILESSLMEYEFIEVRDSLMAGAALLLALSMHGISQPWTPTLEYYSGYKVTDLFDMSNRLLNMLRNPPAQVKTIKTKYSHKIFYEVAKLPLPDQIKID